MTWESIICRPRCGLLGEAKWFAVVEVMLRWRSYLQHGVPNVVVARHPVIQRDSSRVLA